MKHFAVPVELLRVRGEDRVPFVHGLVSNDVRSLAPGTGCGALLLSHRGHALAQLGVFRLEDELVLAVEDGMGAFVRGELERHIIFDQVELSAGEGDFSLLHVAGVQPDAPREDGAVGPRGAMEAAAEPDPSGAVAARAATRLAPPGRDLLVPGDGAGQLALLAARGSRPLDAAEALRERVLAGVAAAATEAGEGVLPQEAGLEGFVSYTKGCYLGQEIMARIEARGNLRRQLVMLRLDGEPAAGERDITLDGRRVGRLGSTVPEQKPGRVALAVLRNDLPADAQLEVGGAVARVSAIAGAAVEAVGGARAA